MPSSHLILCRPLLLLPPIPPSIRVFSNESTLLMRWPKYWSFSFSISPSREHPGLISFRMDWLDLFAVQGTPKSLIQHHSSKATILRFSACEGIPTAPLTHLFLLFLLAYSWISPGCSLEGLMLKLKLQYFGHLMRRVDSLEKTLMPGGIEGRRRRG